MQPNMTGLSPRAHRLPRLTLAALVCMGPFVGAAPALAQTPAQTQPQIVGAAASTYPAVYNAANEQAVEAFHDGRIGFNQIVDLIERVVDAHQPESQLSLESVLAAEKWARDRADAQIAKAC